MMRNTNIKLERRATLHDYRSPTDYIVLNYLVLVRYSYSFSYLFGL